MSSEAGAQPRLPGRGELFTDPATRAVWAAIVALGAAAQHQILEALRDLLACVDGVLTEDVRVRHAIVALREAASLLGHSPSVEEYRLHQKQRGWPADGSVRRWLGGSWNECLRRARLETVPGGDGVSYSMGPAFSREEGLEAIRAYMKENDGAVPTMYGFLGWARRPEVRARYGRLPLSQNTFMRLFGGWLEALTQAVGGAAEVAKLPRSTVARFQIYRVDDESIREALRLVAERIGRSPRMREYMVTREAIMLETEAAGALRALPAASTIQKRYATWDDALADAGLERLGGRHTTSVRRRKYGGGLRVSDAEALAILAEAFHALGHPFTTVAFRRWRSEQLTRDREAGRFRIIPTYDLYWSRFGSWAAAVQAALDTEAQADDEGDDGEAGAGVAA